MFDPRGQIPGCFKVQFGGHFLVWSVFNCRCDTARAFGTVVLTLNSLLSQFLFALFLISNIEMYVNEMSLFYPLCWSERRLKVKILMTLKAFM